jgi:hypothetical protein
VGAVALACYAIHAADRALHHDPYDLFWACHVGCLLVGLGALARRPVVVATGVLWLAFGDPLWLLDLATDGELIPTSVLTHVGGFLIGIPVLVRTGWPRGTWWKAALGLLALMLVTRVATPPRGNVNLAFSVWTGWEHVFPSYGPYFALLMTCAALTFLFVERAIVPLAALARRHRGCDGPVVSSAP